jgi:hypothetical protein
VTGWRATATAAFFLSAAGNLLAAGNTIVSLEQARAEPNLEKRSGLAMDNAMAALKQARAAYQAGDLAQVAAKATEVEDSVDLAYTSLVQTGKDPRKSSRWFKRAEIASRDLLRSLEALERDMSFQDRALLEKLKAKVQQVHDDLLTGLMEGKRK